MWDDARPSLLHRRRPARPHRNGGRHDQPARRGAAAGDGNAARCDLRHRRRPRPGLRAHLRSRHAGKRPRLSLPLPRVHDRRLRRSRHRRLGPPQLPRAPDFDRSYRPRPPCGGVRVVARPASPVLRHRRPRRGPRRGTRLARLRQDRALRGVLWDEARARVCIRASRQRRPHGARLGPPHRPPRPVRRERRARDAGDARRVLRERVPERDAGLLGRRRRGRQPFGGEARDRKRPCSRTGG